MYRCSDHFIGRTDWPDTPRSGSVTILVSTSALSIPAPPCTWPAYSILGQVSVLTVTPSVPGGSHLRVYAWCPTARHNQNKPIIPGSGTRSEVLIADRNDLAVDVQSHIYRHLHTNAEFVVATLPHLYDLDPDFPVYVETVFWNAYIRELSDRYSARMLNLRGMSRKLFTRHSEQLIMRFKRLLAGIIIPTTASYPTISRKVEDASPQQQQSRRLQHILYNGLASPDLLQPCHRELARVRLLRCQQKMRALLVP
ncbi:hypothetical protein J6590_079012 [Homalodisca vitripennis]|nr:hypothetical protein J6590_079012 [Homalodisca vitripennis]